MKEANKIKVTQIATTLQNIPGNTVNGEPGLALVHVKKIHEMGQKLMKIIEDEMEENPCQS